ncbi:MAG: hypothetical protein AAB590_01070 [Patescibacteria group bacterium]
MSLKSLFKKLALAVRVPRELLMGKTHEPRVFESDLSSNPNHYELSAHLGYQCADIPEPLPGRHEVTLCATLQKVEDERAVEEARVAAERDESLIALRKFWARVEEGKAHSAHAVAARR